MSSAWSLTLDCNDAPRLARFWSAALGYVDRPPPEGWATWEDWLRHFDVPEDEWEDGARCRRSTGGSSDASIMTVASTTS